MAIEVSVLRVFTDSRRELVIPLGRSTPAGQHRDRQQLAAQSGYSETIFVFPAPGSTTAHATIHTPRTRNSVRRTPDRRVLVAAPERGRQCCRCPAGHRPGELPR